MKTSGWTADEDRRAQEYLNQDLSFKQVGAALDRSRCSVISRANRKSWDYPGKKRAVGGKRESPRPLPRHELPEAKHELPKPIQHPPHNPPPLKNLPEKIGSVSFIDARNDQCRFVVGDARTLICCGDEVVPGHSWCAHHAQIVYGPTRRCQQPHSPDSTVPQISSLASQNAGCP